MKIIIIQESQRIEMLRSIERTFKRRKRPGTTPIHYHKVHIKKED